ncbi:polyisoprenoid-binding protein [bacterium]|nr:MAG: polyisoprenoid-binding protein [bacterium]
MKWTFEPGHTAAEFCARHMMVTWVRGSFKGVRGELEFDPRHPNALAVEATIDASSCWSGEPARDAHLRSADFLNCERYPTIRFAGTQTRVIGPTDYEVDGTLTIKEIARPVTLDVHFQGTWQTPWWEGGVDLGPKTRAGFTARTRIDRFDFGVDWNAELADGGVVVSPQIEIVLDVEAILVSPS